VGSAVVVVLILLVYVLRNVDFIFGGVLFSYFQAISAFYALKVSWPPVLQSVLGSLSFVNLNLELVSPECLTSLPSSENYAFTYYLTLGSPLALCGLGVVAYCMYLIYADILSMGSPVSKTPLTRTSSQIIGGIDVGQKGTAASYILQALILGMKFLYLSVATKTFELYNCIPEGSNGSYYFEPQPNQRCYVEDWWKVLQPFTIASAIIYVFGFLVFVFVIEYRRRILILGDNFSYLGTTSNTFWTSLDSLILKLTYYTRPAYRPGYEWWDCIILLRKLGIAMTLMFISKNAGIQVLVMSFVFQVSLGLHMRILPYRDPKINGLETMTLVSSIGILLAGVIFFLGEFDAEGIAVLEWISICVVFSSGFVVAVYAFRHMYVSFIESSTGAKLAFDMGRGQKKGKFDVFESDSVGGKAPDWI
jgi:hypothetical protein